MPSSIDLDNGGQLFNIHLDDEGNLLFKANNKNGDGTTRMLIHDDDGGIYLGPSSTEVIRGDDPNTKSANGTSNNGLLIQSAQTVEINIDSNDSGGDILSVTKGSAREELFRVEEDGDVKAKRFIETSDVRHKRNIAPLEGVLDKVMTLRGVNFEWRDTEPSQTGKRIGMIAQEVERVIPEAIVTNADGYKGIAYSDLVALLVESVKAMYTKLNEQQAVIERMAKASGTA